MNSGLEIRFNLARVEFCFQIRWTRSARIAIQQYEVVPAPLLPEIRRALLRRLKSRVRTELPALKADYHVCSLRAQGWHRNRTGIDRRPGA
jgi:hypothetical protein